jgi:uncharacterized membrane protein YeiH
MHTALALVSSVPTTVSSTLAAAASHATTHTSLASLVTSTLPSVVASILPSGVTTSAAANSAVISVPPALELTAAFTGGLSSALAGVKSRFDVFGVATIAVVGGLGGGIIRDVLLQKHGIYALQHTSVLLAVFGAAVIAMFFSTAVDKLSWVRFFIDALALGLFAVAGADKALLAGFTPIPSILLGTITAVGGGILRDILRDKKPQVLQPGTFYAAAAVLGTVLYVLLVDWLNVVKFIALLACVTLVMLLRILSVWRNWQTPTPTDLTPVFANLIHGQRAGEWQSIEDEIEDEIETEDADGP